ncbi:hypothetical protein ABW21_db0202905 [Orbilia brochopaga]|nr:hypothetical protein ABW21_db0202905 [Drechslerella brochopaga]
MRTWKDEILQNHGWMMGAESRTGFLNRKLGDIAAHYNIQDADFRQWLLDSDDRNSAAHLTTSRAVAHFCLLDDPAVKEQAWAKTIFEDQFGASPQDYLETAQVQDVPQVSAFGSSGNL